MGKVLAWVAIGALVWLGWRLWVLSQRRVRASRERAAGDAARGGADAGPGPDRRPDAPELMMQCAVCGVHLPGSEARFAGGRVYCSDAHRDEGVARQGAGDPARRDGR